MSGAAFRVALYLLVILLAAPVLSQDCPGDFLLQNYDGAGQVICTCFVPGEEAGVVLTAPVDHYPIEILKISVGWGSQFGGAPQTLEQALHLYAGSLPDPGAPIFSLPGPALNDGFINQFNIEFTPGNKTIQSGPFTVTLEFLNQTAGQPFAPTVVHDNTACQGGKNVVKAIPGGWNDACVLGVTGDWVMSVEYRCDAATGTHTLTSVMGLLGVSPNPFVNESRISFSLQEPTHTTLQIFDVNGRVVQTLADRRYAPGTHFVAWRGKDAAGDRVAPGIYFVRMHAGVDSYTKKLVVRR